MAYCTIQDVQDFLPEDEQISDIREPLYATVEGWIDPVSTNPINVAFRAAGVTLPIDSSETDLLGMLKVKCAYRVAYEVMAKRTPPMGVGDGSRPPARYFWEAWKSDFDKLIEKIEKGGVVPATTGSTSNLPDSLTKDAETSGEESHQPVFTKGQKF